jgi:hypothetical protein
MIEPPVEKIDPVEESILSGSKVMESAMYQDSAMLGFPFRRKTT